MPRRPRAANVEPTKVIKVSTTPQIGRALEQIVATGYFGKTVSEVAERLLGDRVRAVMLEGWVPKGRSRGR